MNELKKILITIAIVILLVLSLGLITAIDKEIILLPTDYSVKSIDSFQKDGFVIENYLNKDIKITSVDADLIEYINKSKFYFRLKDKSCLPEYHLYTNQLISSPIITEKTQFWHMQEQLELIHSDILNNELNNITKWDITEDKYSTIEDGYSVENIKGYWINYYGTICSTDPELQKVFSSASDAIFVNNTEGSQWGLGLDWIGNTTARYNGAQGTYNSFVFYNSSERNWEITQNIADTDGGTNGFEVNLSDPSLFGYHAFDAKTTCAQGATCKIDGQDLVYGNDAYIDGSENGGDLVEVGQQYGFSGASGYEMDAATNGQTIYLNGDKLMNGSTEMTMCIWTRIRTIQDNDGIYCARNNNVNTKINGFYVDTLDNKVRFLMWDATGTTSKYHVSPSAIDTTSFDFYCATFKGNSHSTIYKNGIPGTNTSTTIPYVSHDEVFRIGWDDLDNARKTSGYFDEVFMYNRTFSDEEIMDLYKATLSQHANTNITVETRTATSYNLTDPNLVSFYSFNEGNATDWSGNGNDGTVSGATWGEDEGTVGGGYSLDGVNDYIKIEPTSNLELKDNDVTWNFWVKPTTSTARQIMLINYATPFTDWFEIEISQAGTTCVTSNGEVRFIVDDGSNPLTIMCSGVTINDNKWHQISITRDSSLNNWSMYLDGDYIKSNYSTDSSVDLAGNYTFGRALEIGVLYPYNYTGAMDEIRFYNRSLSGTEIQDLYELGSSHIEWNDWDSEGIAEDGSQITSTNAGNFMQFKDIFNTNDTLTSPYVLNYSIVEEAVVVAGCPGAMNGNGTNAPCEITNCTQLQLVTENLTANYVLNNSVDCSDTVNWNVGAGFNPIGNSTAPFTGDFLGNNKTITQLFINRTGENNVGLFGGINGVTINNLGLINATVNGSSNTGILVGYIVSSSIINQTYTTGTVKGANDVGGLVGESADSGVIHNSYSTAYVVNAGSSGGLIGRQSGNNNDILNSYSTGNVTASGFSSGGFVGVARGTIRNSFTTGTATGPRAGAFAGFDSGILTITNSYWNNNSENSVECIGTTAEPGCFAIQDDESYFYEHNNPPMGSWDFRTVGAGVWNSVEGANPSVPILTWQGIGTGMLGEGTSDNPYNITTCSQLQDVDYNLTTSYILTSDINCSYTSTWNSALGFEPIGNSTGSFSGNFSGNNKTISNLFINRTASNVGLFGITTAGANLERFGLIGFTIQGSSIVGAIASNYGSINNSFFQGILYGGDSTGTIGINQIGGTLSNVHTNATVVGQDGTGVLIGSNLGPVDNCYSVGSATGRFRVGGFSGRNGALINNSFSVGTAVGSIDVGGFVGNNQNVISASYVFGTTCGYNGGTATCDVTSVSNQTYFQGDVYPTIPPMSYWNFPGIWCERDSNYPSLTFLNSSNCGVINLSYSLNQNIFRFANCSPDWEFYPTYPQGQTNTEGIINLTNDGTIPFSVQTITYPYGQALASNWELYSCNLSSLDPKNDINCVIYDPDEWQTLVNLNLLNPSQVWIYGNCSFVNENPGVSIDFRGGKK